MPTYAMLTTLGPDGWATVRENPERIREVTQEVEGMGLTVVAQYALMGQYDFLNVIESPDEATMARAAIMGRGSTEVQFVTCVVNRQNLDALAALLESGDVKVVIDKTHALSETATAVAHMLGHHARGKVVVTVPGAEGRSTTNSTSDEETSAGQLEAIKETL